MNEIKNSIGILCQHLNLLFDVDLKPEYFRLAKFNKSEDNVVPIFWDVINKLSQSTSLDTVDSAKLSLYKLGYKSVNFYSLPNDMSYGSRDLLLALGYLLSGTVLNDVIYSKIANTPLNPDFNMFPGTVHKHILFNEKQLKTDTERINAAKWMKGKISSNERMIKELELQVAKMLRKVNDTVTISGVEALSLNEILALKKKDYSADFLAKSQHVMNILESCEKWMKKDKIFWNWMNTVLVEATKCQHKIDYEVLERIYHIISNNK